jgi:hypothetical protein
MASEIDTDTTVLAQWVDRSPAGPQFWAIKIPSSGWTMLPGSYRHDAPDHELMGGTVRLFGHQAVKGMRVQRVVDGNGP